MEYEEHQKHEILAKMLGYLVLPFLGIILIMMIVFVFYSFA